MPARDPILHLIAGIHGAGKTSFARAYLRQFAPAPRLLSGGELARGLSPLAPKSVAIKAGKLLLREFDDCLKARQSFGFENALSGATYLARLRRAKALGFRIELHYLWLPSPEFALRRIAQREIMGGQSVPAADVQRRFTRSISHFLELYAPLADDWTFRDNSVLPPALLFDSANASLDDVRRFVKQASAPVPAAKPPAPPLPAFVALGETAATLMAGELRAKHRRWNLPLLSWKDGKILETPP